MINVEAYLGATRTLFPWGRETLWIGLPTHRLNPLVSSCVFSPPYAQILEMDAGGSKGAQVSRVENWGAFVGEVDRIQERRTSYRKLYDASTEPQFKVNQLRAHFHMHGVKDPVVHYVYCRRGDVYALWRYTRFFRHRVAGLDAVHNLARGNFENFYTFDIYATSQIKLEDEDLEIAVMQAHDLDFLYDYIRPALMSACGEPSPHRRIEFPEAPRVITEAIPIAQWIRRL